MTHKKALPIINSRPVSELEAGRKSNGHKKKVAFRLMTIDYYEPVASHQ
jgi:hypothetical protein